MSEIKTGDLVMAVRPMLCGHGTMGEVFVVQDISAGFGVCIHCGNLDYVTVALRPDGNWTCAYRLIKIDPPALPESIETKEELPA